MSLLIRQSGFIANLLKSILQNIPLNPVNFKCNLSSCCSKTGESGGDDEQKILRTYNIPHPPKDPPEDYHPTSMDHEGFEAPDYLPAAVFRPFVSNCEILGPGADKKGCYKNTEYYSFHRYSFAALHMATMKIRKERMNAADLCGTSDSDGSDCEKDRVDKDNSAT